MLTVVPNTRFISIKHQQGKQDARTHTDLGKPSEKECTLKIVWCSVEWNWCSSLQLFYSHSDHKQSALLDKVMLRKTMTHWSARTSSNV